MILTARLTSLHDPPASSASLGLALFVVLAAACASRSPEATAPSALSLPWMSRASNYPLELVSIVNEQSPGENTIIESPLRSLHFGSCRGSRNRPSISCGRETRETRSAGGSSQRVFPTHSIASNLELLLLDVGLFTERAPQRAIHSLFHDGNI